MDPGSVIYPATEHFRGWITSGIPVVMPLKLLPPNPFNKVTVFTKVP